MNSRRIIFVNRYFYPDESATSQILSDLAFELGANSSEIIVVTSRLRYGTLSGPTLQPRDRVANVSIYRVWSTNFGRERLVGRAFDYASFYVSAAILLFRLCNRSTIVVAKTDPPLVSLIVAPVAKVRGSKMVNWIQDLFPEVARALDMRLVSGIVLSALRAARNMTLREAWINVVLGDRMREVLESQGVDPSKIRIVPNWADGSAIRPITASLNPLREAWGLGGSFVVGYSGNLGRAHEFSTILDAAHKLRDRADIKFLFIGGGAQLRTVEDEVNRLGLSNVVFKPYQPRELLAQSLSTADLHLVTLNPSMEGLIVPSKFYGIAAAGRPTLFIGDPDGEIPRILSEGSCGYSVETGDSSEAAAIIATLSRSPELAGELGKNARSIFDRKFDRRIGIKAWMSLLEAADLPRP